MPRIRKSIERIASARLNRSVVLWVFVSVILIEGIILIPSYNNRRDELLALLREVSTARIELILHDAPQNQSDTNLVKSFRKLVDARLLGGTLFETSGKEIGTFGEKPSLGAEAVINDGQMDHLIRSRYIYEFAYRCSDLSKDYILILRHDAASVKNELHAFILRIAGLVLIISFFVTAGAWVALVLLVIDPILKLRQDLSDAAEAVQQDREPSFQSVALARRDELGDVINAFSATFNKVQQSIQKRREAETLLQSSLEEVEAYSRALNSELEKGKQIQRDFLPEHLPESIVNRLEDTAVLSRGETLIIVNDEMEFPVKLDDLLKDMERQYLEEALAKAGGVKKRAAEMLGINFRSFRYRLQKFGIGDEGGK